MAKGHVLITGSSSGIGRAAIQKIRLMTDQPMILAFREKANIKEIADAKYFSFHAESYESVENFGYMLQQLQITHFLQIHGDAQSEDSLENQTYDKLESSFKVNSFSTIILLKYILPKMKAQQFGRILLMNTASSEYGGGEESFGYGLAKHSISFITLHLAKYYTKYNILTNCISPGVFLTEFHTKRMKRTSDELQNRIDSIRLKRAGTLDEISELIYYLTFINSYISGENFKIDGADFI
tara:strand:- start:280 stop:999 length:720 start_codon:yes stop_codon:yes gene_type:complete